MNIWIQYLLLLFAGAFYALGFPTKLTETLFISPIIGVGILLFFLGISNRFESLSLKEAIKKLISFNLGYYFVGFYWIPYTINEFGNIPFPFNQLLGIFFALVISPHLWFLLLLFLGVKKVSYLKKCSQLEFNLYVAFLYTMVEIIIPQQFPAHIGHGWFALKSYLGLVTIFGAPVYSFVSAFLAAEIGSFKVQKVNRLAVLFLFVFIAANIATKIDYQVKSKINVRLVQANIGNFMKIQSEKGDVNSIESVLKKYEKLSLDNPKPIDLLVWPETSFPNLMSSEILIKNGAGVDQFLKDIVNQSKAELFLGGYDVASNVNESYFQTEYNATFLFSANQGLKDVYHKQLLIPFGETLPFGPLNKYLAKVVTNISYFAAGDRFTHFKLDTGHSFISAICYEVLFSNFIRNYLQSLREHPEFIINLTNDSWYGDTSEPYQHLFLAKWRALEFQMPIIRSTNTGITSILYPDGSESERIHLGEFKAKDYELKLNNNGPTLFQRFYLAPLFILFLILLGLSKVQFFRKKLF